MSKIYNFSIALSFFGLWITSMFSGDIEIILGFLLIFSFGILHGSNDILLIDSLSNQKAKHPFIKVLISYLVIVASAVIVFYFLPLLALFLFIIFSAFHFGEQHWDYRTLPLSKRIKHGFYFIYGLLVLQLLFILNPDEVITIVDSIATYSISKSELLISFMINVGGFILLAAYIMFKAKQYRIVLISELFYLLVFAVIFKVSTLIWGFTIYFILWHSIPSLFEQITFIYGNFNRTNTINYLKKALPYWIISLIGIGVVYFMFKDEKLFYAIFFSFLAAITFPHALVMTTMFANKKTQ